MGMIYLAMNSVTGQCYVGLTLRTALSPRQEEHLKLAAEGKGYSFHAALREYGAHSFTWHILYTSNDPYELAAVERNYIAYYSTRYPQGYNHTEGGELPDFIQPKTIPDKGFLYNLIWDLAYAVRRSKDILNDYRRTRRGT